MKSVPKQINVPFGFTIEFSGSRLIALEKIGEYSNSIEGFITQLSYVSANILTVPRDESSEKTRNKTIEAVRRSIAELQNARKWLLHSEYPGDLIDELTRWSEELRPTVKKRIENDNRREIVPSDFLAVGSVAAIFRGSGYEVIANQQTSSLSQFLTTLDTVFRAGGQKRTENSLSQSYYRFAKRWGLLHVFEDARYLSYPSFQGYSENIEISYSRGQSFVAKFSYSPIDT